MSFESYKKITLDDMIDYIEQNGTKADKSDFKKAAYSDKNGEPMKKYNHLNAIRWFCNKYKPELLPVAQEPKAKPTDRLANW